MTLIVTHFRDRDEQYIGRLERNPSAFLLNVRTGGAGREMLHSICFGHLRDPDPIRRPTSPCLRSWALTCKQLDEWAAQHGYMVIECRNCHPRST